jgi:hypothetical protein
MHLLSFTLLSLLCRAIPSLDAFVTLFGRKAKMLAFVWEAAQFHSKAPSTVV